MSRHSRSTIHIPARRAWRQPSDRARRRSSAVRALSAAVVMTLVMVSCATQGDVDPESGIAETNTQPSRSTTTTVAMAETGADPNLTFQAAASDAICDGIRREVGVLRNAQAYEPIDFNARDVPFVLVGEALGDGTFPIYWKCLPSEGNREWRITAAGQDSGRRTTFSVIGRLPPPAKPGGIEVTVVEDPFSCDDDERVLVELDNLTPNVELDIDIAPATKLIVGEQADKNGELTIFWRCSLADVPTSWLVTIHESTPEPRRRATFRFRATDEPYQPDADIEVYEDPFVCDDTSRQFAVLSKFVPYEFVRFSSPQSGNIRGGQADLNGKLLIRWQCDPEQVGVEWEVTATGSSSLATVTFTIVGAEPE